MTLVALGGGPGMLKSSLESRAWSAVAANIYSFYSELMHDFTSERHKVFAQISWVKCLCLWAIKLSCKEITKKKKITSSDNFPVRPHLQRKFRDTPVTSDPGQIAL